MGIRGLNNRQAKTLKALFAEPTPSGIQWREIESLFSGLGAVIQQGKGSRVRVALNGVKAVFHEPHPEKEASKYTVRDVRDFLKTAGVEP